MSPCDQYETMSRYLDGEADSPVATAFEGHLAGCARCASDLAELRFLGDSIRQIDAPETTKDRLDALFAPLDQPAPLRKASAEPWWSVNRWPRPSRVAALVAGILAALIAVVSIGVMASRQSQPKADADVAVVAKFVASGRFNRLPDAEKSAYLEALGRKLTQVNEAAEQGRITRQERLRVVEILAREQFRKMIDGYYALPPGLQRQKYLDHLLDEQEKWVRSLPPAMREDLGQGAAGPSAEELTRKMPAATAQDQARIATFLEELKKRRESRSH